MQERSLFSTTSPAFIVCRLFDDGHSDQEEKGMTKDEMAGWHHRLDGREFE